MCSGLRFMGKLWQTRIRTQVLKSLMRCSRDNYCRINLGPFFPVYVRHFIRVKPEPSVKVNQQLVCDDSRIGVSKLNLGFNMCPDGCRRGAATFVKTKAPSIGRIGAEIERFPSQGHIGKYHAKI